MNLRAAGMVDDSITDGPGLRLAVFAQGCNFHCPGCHNPEAHDPRGGYDLSIEEVLRTAERNPLLSGVTFSGGEPFLQAAAFAELARRVKSAFPRFTIITYTGYTWEELQKLPDARELVEQSDFIMDGRYKQEQKSYDLQFCGSTNQRIIDVKMLLGLIGRINELLLKKERTLLAIDGMCASGKTTLAALLKPCCPCNIISADDFFLRPHQRTAERLAEPGGNVDYERLNEEVLLPLLAGKDFSYSPYDCRADRFLEKVQVSPKPLSIIEGVYSLHPLLSSAYDIKIFSETTAETQKKRLQKRSPDLYERFINEWIPMENRYFDVFEIKGRCDVVAGAGMQSMSLT